MTSRGTLLAGAAAAIFFAAPALAETTDSVAPAVAADAVAESGGSSDNAIIVTGRRREESAQEVPIAISVLDSAQINDTGAFSIQKLQQLAPTLQVYSSNPRNTSINIRGLGVPFGLTNDGFEQGVGVYVDDVYYARPASAVTDLLDVAQVEVLRGPQGTLYGKNTTAGAINITTNQPSFDFEGSAEVSVGNLGFKQAKAAVSGPISDTVAARIAVSSTSRRGTIYNVTTENYINAQDNIGVRGQLLFRPNSDLDITLTGDYTTQDAECCGTVYYDYGPTQRAVSRQYPALAAALGYEVVSTNPYDRLTDIDASLNAGNILGGASLRVNWDIGPGKLTSVTAWRFWDWKPENDRDYTGLPITSRSQNPSQQNQYSQELRYNYSGDSLDFVIGAFGFHQRIDTQGTESQGSASSRWNLNPSSQAQLIADNVLDGLVAYNTQYLKSTSLAAFSQVSWKVTDQLTIQPGVRVNYDKKDGFYQREVFDKAGNAVPATGGTAAQAAQRGIYAPQLITPSGDEWNFSYDLTVSYAVTPDVLLYGTYAKSFKTFGLNQNGVPALNGVAQVDLATAKPESVNHFEAGLKTQFWDRKATFNLSAFRTTIDDFQANVISTRDPGLVRPYIANAEQARTQGVEVDLSIRPSERFTAYVNGAYTDAEYVSFTQAPPPPEYSGGTVLPIDSNGNIIGTPAAPGTVGSSPPYVDASGGALPGVSKWSFSYGAEANAPVTLLGNEGQIYFGVDGSYRSEFSSNPTPSIYTWIDGYALTNFRLGFRTDNGLNIYGWVRNAFDTNYMQELTAVANTGLIVGIPGDQRTWGGTIRYQF